MKFFKRYLETILVVIFLLLVGAGFLLWKSYRPTVDEFKSKNPPKFEQMAKEFGDLHFIKGTELLREIKHMTHDEVLLIRYELWKERIKSDKKFRLEEWDNQLAERENTKKARRMEHLKEIADIERLNKKGGEKVLFASWKKAGPWEKGLILREKCIKYLELERKDNVRRRNPFTLSRTAVLLHKPAGTSLEVPELCAKLVTISHDAGIEASNLETLRNEMNYFYFVRLLDEVGIPRQEVLPFSIQLTRMTADFPHS